MNFSTVPPYSSIKRRQMSKYGESSSRTSSASPTLGRVVNPTRSANSTDTSRRSAANSATSRPSALPVGGPLSGRHEHSTSPRPRAPPAAHRTRHRTSPFARSRRHTPGTRAQRGTAPVQNFLPRGLSQPAVRAPSHCKKPKPTRPPLPDAATPQQRRRFAGTQAERAHEKIVLRHGRARASACRTAIKVPRPDVNRCPAGTVGCVTGLGVTAEAAEREHREADRGLVGVEPERAADRQPQLGIRLLDPWVDSPRASQPSPFRFRRHRERSLGQ